MRQGTRGCDLGFLYLNFLPLACLAFGFQRVSKQIFVSPNKYFNSGSYVPISKSRHFFVTQENHFEFEVKIPQNRSEQWAPATTSALRAVLVVSSRWVGVRSRVLCCWQSPPLPPSLFSNSRSRGGSCAATTFPASGRVLAGTLAGLGETIPFGERKSLFVVIKK